MSKLTAQTALEQATTMIKENASRSKVCSFINSLASAKLITGSWANDLVDILEMDRSNNKPVLVSIISKLISSVAEAEDNPVPEKAHHEDA